MEKTKLGLSQNVEGALAYSLPGLAFFSGLILLFLETDNKFVRFHSMQSFMLFGFYGIAAFVLKLIPFLGSPLLWLLGVVMFISWVALILNAFQGKYFKFPIIGEVIYAKIVE